MSNGEGTVRRTLHLRFTLPGADPDQLVTMMRASAPFYQLFGNAQLKLLRNADDPTKFIQVIDYETPEHFELNRQSIAERYAPADLSAGLARHAPRRAGDRRLSGSLRTEDRRQTTVCHTQYPSSVLCLVRPQIF